MGDIFVEKTGGRTPICFIVKYWYKETYKDGSPDSEIKLGCVNGYFSGGQFENILNFYINSFKKFNNPNHDRIIIQRTVTICDDPDPDIYKFRLPPCFNCKDNNP